MATDFPSIRLGQSGRFQMVRVTNRNSFPLIDRFDGVPYEFKPNEPLSIAMEVATHVFGWPAEPELMRLHIAKRFGWNTPDDIKRGDDGKMRWETWVDNLHIEPVHMELVERDPSAPIPADPSADDGPMAETQSEVPIPLAEGTEVGGTRGGVRSKAPRRVDV
jgi:hypothetical protein